MSRHIGQAPDDSCGYDLSIYQSGAHEFTISGQVHGIGLQGNNHSATDYIEQEGHTVGLQVISYWKASINEVGDIVNEHVICKPRQIQLNGEYSQFFAWTGDVQTALRVIELFENYIRGYRKK